MRKAFVILAAIVTLTTASAHARTYGTERIFRTHNSAHHARRARMKRPAKTLGGWSKIMREEARAERAAAKANKASTVYIPSGYTFGIQP